VLTESLLGGLIEQGMALNDDMVGTVDALVAQGDWEMLIAYLVERQEHYSDPRHNTQVSYLVVTTAGGESYVVPDDAAIPSELTGLSGEFVEDEETLLLADDDVVEYRTVLPETGATLRFGLSKEPIQRTVNHVLLRLVAIILVMVAVGFAAAFLLTWILTRPILDLVEATQAVTKGDLSQQVARWANDEIGELAVSFNAMIESLREAEAERAEREQLREQYVSNTIRAQENERQRIARELHDSTSQSLTSLLVGLQNLKGSSSEEERNQRIDDCGADARRSARAGVAAAAEAAGRPGAGKRATTVYRRFPGALWDSGGVCGERAGFAASAGDGDCDLSHRAGGVDQHCALCERDADGGDCQPARGRDPDYYRG
jgi:methyl-accepting chemotaxis protein